MVTFIVVRHGFSKTNASGIFAGVTDALLTEQGVRQGQLACEFIYKNYKVDAIYSSDLSRAFNTVKDLSEKTGVPIIKKQTLREMDCGVWENLDIQTLISEYGEQFKRWGEIDDTAIPKGGESWLKTGERMYSEFINIAKENDKKTVVVATHGVAIRALRGKYLGLPLNEWKKIPYAPNASITVIQYQNGVFTEKAIIDEYLGDLKTEMPKGI